MKILIFLRYKLVKVWQAYKLEKKTLQNEKTMVEMEFNMFEMNLKYQNCKSTHFIMEMIESQNNILGDMESLIEKNWDKISLNKDFHRKIIKDYLIKLCSSEIDLCRSTFSEKYLKEILGEKDGQELVDRLLFLKFFGPITSIGVSNSEEDESKFMAMG